MHRKVINFLIQHLQTIAALTTLVCKIVIFSQDSTVISMKQLFPREQSMKNVHDLLTSQRVFSVRKQACVRHYSISLSTKLSRSERRGATRTSTVIAVLTYAASAWRGLTKASDRQRINSVIDRARRLGYCAQNLQNFDELCDAANDELFSEVAQLSNHVLHELYPPHHNNTTSATARTHCSCLNTAF